MATEAPKVETTDSTKTDGTEESSDQTQQDGQTATPETGGNGTDTSSNPAEPVKLPDDHPLVKTLNTQKTTIASQKTELTELRAKSAQVTKLEEELNARPTKEAVETLQTRYDRLEAFIQAAGGDISKALDSRTFTRDLFETDKDIDAIVKDWNRAHPSATSTALGSAAAAPAAGKVDQNALLRAAIK